MRWAGSAPHSGGMLWSDPADDTPAEAARVRGLLRRVGILIALCASLAMVVVMASWG